MTSSDQLISIIINSGGGDHGGHCSRVAGGEVSRSVAWRSASQISGSEQGKIPPPHIPLINSMSRQHNNHLACEQFNDDDDLVDNCNASTRERTRGATSATTRGESNKREERRIKRLLSMFPLWRSRTEMSFAAASAAPTEAALAASASLQSTTEDNQTDRMASRNNFSQSEQRNQQHQQVSALTLTHENQDETSQSMGDASNLNTRRILERQHHHSLVFIPNSYVEHQISLTPSLADETLRETKRFWQSLVLPLVLGCLIILVVVWTRQIMFYLVNDTIIMVIILGAVFVIMSAIAFWLAQEQQLTSDDTSVMSTEEIESANQQQQQHHHHHHHHCSHLWNQPSHFETYCHNHQYHLNRQQQASHPNGSEEAAVNGRKCCNRISIIDCQPPDYYSAMKDSLPVSLNARTPSLPNFGPSSVVNSEELRAGSLNYDEPPKYEEYFSINGQNKS